MLPQPGSKICRRKGRKFGERPKLNGSEELVPTMVDPDILEDVARELGNIRISQCCEVGVKFQGWPISIFVAAYPMQGKPNTRGAIIALLPHDNRATQFVRERISGITALSPGNRRRIVANLDDKFQATFQNLDPAIEYVFGLQLRT